MERVSYSELLEAGVHFGHLKRKWHPKMAPYIFMDRNDIHLIDLNKTAAMLDEAAQAIKQIARSGRKVMFVATKKQAKEIIATEAKRLNMPYVTERWLGGMLTNFATVRKSIKKLTNIEKMQQGGQGGAWETLSKKERLMMLREKDKLERVLGGIANEKSTPAALFVIDIKKEHIAIKEAHRLGIPVIAMVDTNSDPSLVDFPIPSNDDATKSIALITSVLTRAMEEGIDERKRDKDAEPEEAPVVEAEGDENEDGNRRDNRDSRRPDGRERRERTGGPRPPYAGGDRPAGGGDRPAGGGDRGPRPPYNGGDRGPRPERSGDRPAGGGDRPNYAGGDRGPRPARSEGAPQANNAPAANATPSAGTAGEGQA